MKATKYKAFAKKDGTLRSCRKAFSSADQLCEFMIFQWFYWKDINISMKDVAGLGEPLRPRSTLKVFKAGFFKWCRLIFISGFSFHSHEYYDVMDCCRSAQIVCPLLNSVLMCTTTCFIIFNRLRISDDVIKHTQSVKPYGAAAVSPSHLLIYFHCYECGSDTAHIFTANITCLYLVAARCGYLIPNTSW